VIPYEHGELDENSGSPEEMNVFQIHPEETPQLPAFNPAGVDSSSPTGRQGDKSNSTTSVVAEITDFNKNLRIEE
jgi:hypothetical protein